MEASYEGGQGPEGAVAPCTWYVWMGTVFIQKEAASMRMTSESVLTGRDVSVFVRVLVGRSACYEVALGGVTFLC